MPATQPSCGDTKLAACGSFRPPTFLSRAREAPEPVTRSHGAVPGPHAGHQSMKAAAAGADRGEWPGVGAGRVRAHSGARVREVLLGEDRHRTCGACVVADVRLLARGGTGPDVQGPGRAGARALHDHRVRVAARTRCATGFAGSPS